VEYGYGRLCAVQNESPSLLFSISFAMSFGLCLLPSSLSTMTLHLLIDTKSEFLSLRRMIASTAFGLSWIAPHDCCCYPVIGCRLPLLVARSVP
jgi:hypothetical protein